MQPNTIYFILRIRWILLRYGLILLFTRDIMMRTLCMHGFTLSLSRSLRVRTLGHENPVKWWFKFIRPYYNVDWIFHYFKYLTSATNKRQWRRNGTMTVRSFSSFHGFVGIFCQRSTSSIRCHCPTKCISNCVLFHRSSHCHRFRMKPYFPLHWISH